MRSTTDGRNDARTRALGLLFQLALGLTLVVGPAAFADDVLSVATACSIFAVRAACTRWRPSKASAASPISSGTSHHGGATLRSDGVLAHALRRAT